MKWSHQVNPGWLTERKNYLSASDVKKLIPVTATGRPRSNMTEAYTKVWAEKQARITEDDICSSGVMARGHLLEPYAIAEFNKLGIVQLEHWDDCLIYSLDKMSCSPDSLDIVQQPEYGTSLGGVSAQHMGEVKAYNAAIHYSVGMGDKMTLEERWQIATAFHVIPTLKSAFLILYHPGVRHPLFWHEYVRAELKHEITMVGDVITEYAIYSLAAEGVAATLCPPMVAKACVLEEQIIIEMLEAEQIAAGLNP